MEILSIMSKIETPKTLTLEGVKLFIRDLGFPIFMALLLGYFVWHNENFLREQISSQNEERREMIKVLQENNQKLHEISIKLDSQKK